ncbi:hypothetical protein Tsubulata_051394 [Turnera subulata]|uniref:Uncharacterized protein n=1 Tax=Turnera subulata TaxID=218843 RepID=A0A9Q0GB49_9ROSI|nr:hypothetical protein Tsubulata_051394 [Turnera subulata]
MASRHSIDPCLFQLHSWNPFRMHPTRTRPTRPAPPNLSTPLPRSSGTGMRSMRRRRIMRDCCFGPTRFGDTDVKMEMVGENTFSDQKAHHHRCRRKKHDLRMHLMGTSSRILDMDYF